MYKKCTGNGISTVSKCSQQWYIFRYKQMSQVMLFVLILPYHSEWLELTKLDLDHTGCDLNKRSRETGRWHEQPPGRDLLSPIKRVQKFDCSTPDLSETAVHFHEAEAAVEKKQAPWLSWKSTCFSSWKNTCLSTCNVSPRTTMRWRISSFRAILR